MSVITESNVMDDCEVTVLEADLDEATYERAREAELVAWDIETTGLDWREDLLATVQLKAGECVVLVRLDPGAIPRRLKALLEDERVTKVMHHAMFDLRFMAHKWAAVPRNVVCTKIASKIAHQDFEKSDHSLDALVDRYFGVTLDKHQRLSDWTAERLEPAQLRYAADDVRYLRPLYERLASDLEQRDLLNLRDRCYEHLPARVALEIGGYQDVFAY
jgi:ribonuclease D